MNEERKEVFSVFKVIKKRIVLILCITLIATIGTFAISKFILQPTYECSTKLYIGKGSTEENANYDYTEVTMYQKLIKTYLEAFKSRDLLSNALSGSKYNVNVDNVLANLKVSSVTDTQIIEVSYTSSSYDEANDTLERINKEFIKEAKILVPNGSVQVLDSVYGSANPTSPNTKLNTLMGLCLGFISAVAISLILEYLDKSYRDANELEMDTKVEVLASIPKMK